MKKKEKKKRRKKKKEKKKKIDSYLNMINNKQTNKIYHYPY